MSVDSSPPSFRLRRVMPAAVPDDGALPTGSSPPRVRRRLLPSTEDSSSSFPPSPPAQPLRRLLSVQQLSSAPALVPSFASASSRPRRSLASGSRVSTSSTNSSASMPRSSSLPSLSRAEISNQALKSRAHAIAFIGSLAGSDVGSFLSMADVFLSLSEDNVPTADLSQPPTRSRARTSWPSFRPRSISFRPSTVPWLRTPSVTFVPSRLIVSA
ncbi:hypothetical protein CF336_g6913 [Tilletia laevis]|nr:hypothetical protein CF336_g6913 [Tilletia laevis]